jgi:hypothetical protein
VAVIVVGGSEKGVGKTTLICGLIAALAEYRWTAVKITSHDYGRPESIWEETAIAAPIAGVPATDTARFLSAGAHRALLVTVEEAAMDLKVAELQKQLEPAANIIYESNRIMHYLKPSLCLGIVGGEVDEAKASFAGFLRKADAVVALANAKVNQGSMPPDLQIFRLMGMDRIPEEMLGWVRSKLKTIN